jgi:hypothetical protein
MKSSKSLWLIPTEKPSRLVLDTVNKNLFLTTTKDFGTKIMQFQNIYITSNEEIKEGDWYIDRLNIVQKSEIVKDSMLLGKNQSIGAMNIKGYDKWSSQYNSKKIILTTDEQLINDGVQSIDDEFLEWFVKNPSCEFVEVDKIPDLQSYNEKTNNCELVYIIIIPQEEPKQCCDSGIVDDFCINTLKCKHAIEISKQETLEEAAENFVKVKQFRTEEKDKTRLYSFIQGAKWQAERMYSEEEVISLLNDFAQHLIFNKNSSLNIIEWFEQFKKK